MAVREPGSQHPSIGSVLPRLTPGSMCPRGPAPPCVTALEMESDEAGPERAGACGSHSSPWVPPWDLRQSSTLPPLWKGPWKSGRLLPLLVGPLCHLYDGEGCSRPGAGHHTGLECRS